MSPKTLIKWSNKITPTQVQKLMQAERDVNKAKIIFDSATAEYANGFQHDHTTFGSIISRLASANQFKAAEELLNRMKNEKVSFTEGIFLSIFRAYGRAHKPLDVLRVFQMMKEFEFEPTELTYVTVFSILVRENQLKMAQKFYKYMKESGVPPSVTIINVLIKALCMNEKTMEAGLRVFRQMSDHGCTPDAYSYGTLINGICKFGKVAEAKELFQEMQTKGCLPTVVTYTSLINGLCHSGNIDEAMELLEKMSSNGIEPNVITFSSLMDGLCKVGRSSEAIEILEKMNSKRHAPNMITYCTVINGLCKEGNLQGAVEVLDRMKLQGLKPDAGLYGKLITGFCDLSKFRDAANFLDEMILGGISPNRVTWTLHVKIHNMVVQGLCIDNDLNRSFQVYLSMRTRGISIYVETFNSLVSCFCKKGDVHKAARIVSEMVVDGCIPDEGTWKAAVSGIGCRKKAREAADLLQNELIGVSVEPEP
ncbi:Pentatricopeptide repeat-containing protein [Thalictrum thalictroides]|uniref:Pentatricopeptide repeat-containing protein n=1 Tax=Thalictrum thalictroides TaxID=46969 RepID=A0A7J6UU19_THATH|nr:Pentatricopeptide repeat-containing protein [Thalictrum thalictroides]